MCMWWDWFFAPPFSANWNALKDLHKEGARIHYLSLLFFWNQKINKSDSVHVWCIYLGWCSHLSYNPYMGWLKSCSFTALLFWISWCNRSIEVGQWFGESNHWTIILFHLSTFKDIAYLYPMWHKIILLHLSVVHAKATRTNDHFPRTWTKVEYANHLQCSYKNYLEFVFFHHSCAPPFGNLFWTSNISPSDNFWWFFILFFYYMQIERCNEYSSNYPWYWRKAFVWKKGMPSQRFCKRFGTLMIDPNLKTLVARPNWT